MRPHLPAGLAGLLGVLLNVLAVAALGPIPHTYRPGNVAAWLAETVANPTASTLSAWAFTVGLVALAAFCVGLAFAVRTPWSVLGARLLAVAGPLWLVWVSWASVWLMRRLPRTA